VSGSLPIWVVLFVVLGGGLGHPSPQTPTARGAGGTAASAAGGSPPVLQSTANLTCQASKLLGQSCAPDDLTPAARPGTAGVNPKTWTDLTDVETNAPSARYLSMMVFDPVDGYVLLFGGADTSGSLSDTWSFAHGQWTELSPSNSPGGRYLAGIAWDVADGYVVMFGGYSLPSGAINNETWTYVHGTWTNLTGTTNQTPGPRWRPLMTYDAGDGFVLMYGGTTAVATYSDTWEFLHGNWTALTVSGSPPPRFRASMVYDPVDNDTVVFGGCTSFACSLPDSSTWKFHNLTWSALSPSSHPSARVYYGLTYSSIANTVLLFGGSTVPTSASGALADTWNFTGGNWTSLTSSLTASPPSLAYLGMVFDPLDGYTIAFGGQYSNATYSNETWALGPSILGEVSVSPGAIDLGQSVTINAKPFGHPGYVVYNYTTLPPGCVSANVSALSCTPNAIGVFPVVVVRNDSGGVPSTANATVIVDADLTIASYTSSADNVTVGSSVEFNATASGGTSPLSYRFSGLPPGCSTANRPTLNCTPAAAGLYTIQVNVTDAAHYAVGATVTLNVSEQPTVTQLTALPTTLDVHQSLRLVALLTGGTPPIQYNWTGLPTGCASSDSAMLTCRPSSPGAGFVTLTATDADGWVANGSVRVDVAADPAFISGAASPSAVDVGTSVTVWANVSGGTGTISFAYFDGPAGCVLGNSAENSCVPSTAGTFTIEAQATDSAGFSIFENITLAVNPPMSLPTVAATPTAIDLGQNVTVNATAVGGTSPYTFAFSGLPRGCTPVAPSASVSCTPSVAGTYEVTVLVTDALGQAMTGSGALVVHRDPSVVLRVVSGTPTSLGNSLSLQAAAANGSGGFTYSYTGLPTGCISRNSSALTCTPTATGNYLVIVTVVDSLGVSATSRTFANVTSTSSTTVLGLPTMTFDLLLVALVLLVAIAASVLVFRRRQRSSPPPREPAPEESTEEVYQ
jgi:Galactose oxidase, central domain